MQNWVTGFYILKIIFTKLPVSYHKALITFYRLDLQFFIIIRDFTQLSVLFSFIATVLDFPPFNNSINTRKCRQGVWRRKPNLTNVGPKNWNRLNRRTEHVKQKWIKINKLLHRYIFEMFLLFIASLSGFFKAKKIDPDLSDVILILFYFLFIC